MTKPNEVAPTVDPAAARTGAKRQSKEAEARERQGYTMDAPCCARCAHFRVETEQVRFNAYSDRTWTRESQLRCTLGHFAPAFKVKKSAWCRFFSGAAVRVAAASSHEQPASKPKDFHDK